MLNILIDSKLLRINFKKKNGFIRVYDGTRYLAWFWDNNYDFI